MSAPTQWVLWPSLFVHLLSTSQYLDVFSCMTLDWRNKLNGAADVRCFTSGQSRVPKPAQRVCLQTGVRDSWSDILRCETGGLEYRLLLLTDGRLHDGLIPSYCNVASIVASFTGRIECNSMTVAGLSQIVLSAGKRTDKQKTPKRRMDSISCKAPSIVGSLSLLNNCRQCARSIISRG